MLQKLLSQIMDLPFPLDEAQKKLQKTYMVLNGNLVYVKEIREDGIIVADITGLNAGYADKEVKTLEVYTPDSGVFVIDGVPFCVRKHPTRQWKKSFTWDFYHVTAPDGHANIDTYEFPFKMFLAGGKEFWKDDQFVYYYNLVIGKVSPSGQLLIENKLFEQEIMDLQRDSKEWKPNQF